MMQDRAYFSYLLRIWRVVRTGKPTWMASLDEPQSGKRHSFTSLGSLIAFLLQNTLEAGLQTGPQAGERDDQDHSPESAG
jgi:hypothetical protein